MAPVRISKTTNLGNFRQFDYKLVGTDIYLPEILFKA